jgi:hypothetical protein
VVLERYISFRLSAHHVSGHWTLQIGRTSTSQQGDWTSLDNAFDSSHLIHGTTTNIYRISQTLRILVESWVCTICTCTFACWHTGNLAGVLAVFVAFWYRIGVLLESRYLRRIRGTRVCYCRRRTHSVRGHLGMRFLILALWINFWSVLFNGDVNYQVYIASVTDDRMCVERWWNNTD